MRRGKAEQREHEWTGRGRGGQECEGAAVAVATGAGGVASEGHVRGERRCQGNGTPGSGLAWLRPGGASAAGPASCPAGGLITALPRE